MPSRHAQLQLYDLKRLNKIYCCLCILIVRPYILTVVFVFLLFVHIFLLLSMYSYCSSMYSYCCLCVLIVRPYILTVVYVFLLFRPYILTVVYVFLLFVHVFLLLSLCSYCSSMYSYRCLCILIVVYVFLDAATLTEVFPCFFLGCKANARV